LFRRKIAIFTRYFFNAYTWQIFNASAKGYLAPLVSAIVGVHDLLIVERLQNTMQ
jgi:hypothetical protein